MFARYNPIGKRQKFNFNYSLGTNKSVSIRERAVHCGLAS